MSAQVITTKFLGPTNTQGPRVKISSRFGSKIIDFREDAKTTVGVDNEILAEEFKNLYAKSFKQHNWTAEDVLVQGIAGPDENLCYWIVSYKQVF